MLTSKRRNIFISYSHSDISLVKMLEQLINERPDLYPLIIANNREAQKPLVEKVSKGINESDILIPILSQNSINAQWINQEIGFASALNKTIFPIIEDSILKLLKGFVHKEVDQPYIYNSTSKDSFADVAKLLIQDILVVENLDPEPIPKTIQLAKELKENTQYEALRKAFQDSPHSVQKVINELYDKLFPYLESQLELIRNETKLPFPNEMISDNPHGYIVKSNGYSFSFVWEQRFNNNIIESKLVVRRWKGFISFERNDYPPSETPQNIKTTNFEVDLDRNQNIVWTDKGKQRTRSGEKIIDECFTWLLSEINK